MLAGGALGVPAAPRMATVSPAQLTEGELETAASYGYGGHYRQPDQFHGGGYSASEHYQPHSVSQAARPRHPALPLSRASTTQCFPGI